MLNFNAINIWITSKRVGDPIRIQGVKGSSERKACQNFKRDIMEVERILKAREKIIRKQTLESLNPGILDLFFPTNWEKNLIYIDKMIDTIKD